MATAALNYTGITERPGVGASREQLRILCTRYGLAAKLADDRDVLEVACGAGVGLGMLSRSAKSVTAGDIDGDNCEVAQRTHAGDPRIAVRQFAAEELPFATGSFDLIVLFEAFYYLQDRDRFLRECRRVLRSGGQLVISTVNSRWHGFNPSPLNTGYLDAAELAKLLASHCFSSSLYVAFPDEPHGLARHIISAVRRVAVGWHLIPGTMKGKEFLKRIFYGALVPIPAALTGSEAESEPLVPVSSLESTESYKFIYALAGV
jgi:SAM-dependent methyltransferase